MVAKLKDKFLPRDYPITLFRQIHNLKQRLFSVRQYIKELYKINIREGYIEDTSKKVARYINGIRIDI
jgi:hypothetical protein